MRVVAEYIWSIGGEVGRFYHGYGEVFRKVTENGELAEKGKTATSVLGCSVDKEDPNQVGD